MYNWSHDAITMLNDYLAAVRAALRGSDADPDEVAADVRRHVLAELAAQQVQAVTGHDVQRVLQRLGVPENFKELTSASGAPLSACAAPRPLLKPFAAVSLVLGGVVLPFITIAFEFVTGLCASALFDPLPTMLHAALIVLVIVANALMVRAVYLQRAACPRVLAWLNSIAMGVALYYALALLPFLPFMLMALVFFGAGLIPLGPYFGLISAWVLRYKLRRLCTAAHAATWPRAWHGILVGLALLVAADLPKLVTLAGMQLAVQSSPARQRAGVQMLRRFGNDAFVLRACYVRDVLAADVPTFVWRLFFRPLDVARVRGLYYRVTGTPFNAVEPPRLTGPRGGRMTNADEFDFEQGGSSVAAPVRGLRLVQSRLDADVHADAGTAYLQWTLEFRNDSGRQREARARIALPPGAVVSRLTLWIDGEEREAAFGPRADVTRAYRDIVAQRRDPVLVTTCGPDQILLQCFPVPPDGGTMKTRVGISVPVALLTLSNGAVRLPQFLERNFSLASELHHSVWIESATTACFTHGTAPLTVAPHARGGCSVHGTLPATDLDRARTVHVARNPLLRDMWAPAPHAADGAVVRQHIEALTPPVPQRIVIVIDGSQRMAQWTNVIARALAHMPPVDTPLVLAGDTVTSVYASAPGSLPAALAQCTFRGGCDNIPALVHAWDLAAAARDGVIVWLHAGQPVALSGTEELAQRWKRRPRAPLLYELQFGTGANAVRDELPQRYPAGHVPAAGEPDDDLAALLRRWHGDTVSYEYRRWQDDASNVPPAAIETDAHLARLWARDSVWELTAAPGAAAHAAALVRATNFHLVTPVSGAVVLETAQQYVQAGLQPVDPALMPDVIPEPSAGLLLLGGMIMLLARRARRHA